MMKSVKSRWRCALVIWLVAYPLITTLLYLLEPTVGGWPLPLRTLLVSSIMVPVMVLWLVPALAARVSAFLETATPPRLPSSQRWESDQPVGCKNTIGTIV